VPTNEVLGLVIQCGEEAPTSLIVFDKVLASCLVTAADINVEATFDYTESFVKGASKSHELRADAALDAHFGATGNGNNGWTSGILAFPARVDFRNSGPCAVQGISANKAVGNLKGISGGTHFAIVITKGTIVTSGQVGTLGP